MRNGELSNEGEKWLDNRGLMDLRDPSTTERCNEPTLRTLSRGQKNKGNEDYLTASRLSTEMSSSTDSQ